jgi:hypothetical protein
MNLSYWKKLLFIMICAGGCLPCWAGSKVINVQGKLTSASGSPLINPSVTFRLYTSSTIAGSPTTCGQAGNVCAWSSNSLVVTTSTGLFNVPLQGGTPSLDTLPFNVPYYLGIWVTGDTKEMSPRQLLGATAYALGSLGNFNVEGNMTSGGTMTAAQGIVGTTTNDNAAAGNVGQSVRMAFSGSFGASGVWSNVTSIVLSPGDWDVSGVVEVSLNGATWSGPFSVAISSSSGTSVNGQEAGDNQIDTLPPTSGASSAAVIPSWRVSLSTATTFYLKSEGSYSGAKPVQHGRLSARRVR